MGNPREMCLLSLLPGKPARVKLMIIALRSTTPEAWMISGGAATDKCERFFVSCPTSGVMFLWEYEKRVVVRGQRKLVAKERSIKPEMQVENCPVEFCLRRAWKFEPGCKPGSSGAVGGCDGVLLSDGAACLVHRGLAVCPDQSISCAFFCFLHGNRRSARASGRGG
jgi:hypothetical protein